MIRIKNKIGGASRNECVASIFFYCQGIRHRQVHRYIRENLRILITSSSWRFFYSSNYKYDSFASAVNHLWLTFNFQTYFTAPKHHYYFQLAFWQLKKVSRSNENPFSSLDMAWNTQLPRATKCNAQWIIAEF